MRRTTTAAISTMAIAGALTFGTAYATQAGTDDGSATTTPTSPTSTTTPVLNKVGHEVDFHAAKGQARAAEARAKHLSESPTADPSESTGPTGVTDAAEPAEVESDEPAETPTATPTHAPNAHAGTRPDTHAFAGGTDHGKDGLPHGQGHAYGHDPAHAGQAKGHDKGGTAAE